MDTVIQKRNNNAKDESDSDYTVAMSNIEKRRTIYIKYFDI